MRNREQIYGQEAAELLRNITVYHCIRHDQLLRLMCSYRNSSWKVLR